MWIKAGFKLLHVLALKVIIIMIVFLQKRIEKAECYCI